MIKFTMNAKELKTMMDKAMTVSLYLLYILFVHYATC